jgi:hypothetical protein
MSEASIYHQALRGHLSTLGRAAAAEALPAELDAARAKDLPCARSRRQDSRSAFDASLCMSPGSGGIPRSALSDCRVEELPGRQHTAHLVAPEPLADKILAFLS